MTEHEMVGTADDQLGSHKYLIGIPDKVFRQPESADQQANKNDCPFAGFSVGQQTSQQCQSTAAAQSKEGYCTETAEMKAVCDPQVQHCFVIEHRKHHKQPAGKGNSVKLISIFHSFT